VDLADGAKNVLHGVPSVVCALYIPLTYLLTRSRTTKHRLNELTHDGQSMTIAAVSHADAIEIIRMRR